MFKFFVLFISVLYSFNSFALDFKNNCYSNKYKVGINGGSVSKDYNVKLMVCDGSLKYAKLHRGSMNASNPSSMSDISCDDGTSLGSLSSLGYFIKHDGGWQQYLNIVDVSDSSNVLIHIRTGKEGWLGNSTGVDDNNYKLFVHQSMVQKISISNIERAVYQLLQLSDTGSYILFNNFWYGHGGSPATTKVHGDKIAGKNCYEPIQTSLDRLFIPKQ